MEIPRLIDYFAVYGLNDQHLIEAQAIYTEKGLQDVSDGTSILNAISSLRLRITNEDEVLMASKTKFLSCYELAARDSKRLWLEIVYGRRNGQVRNSWNGKAISKIELYYLPCEDSFVKVPVTHPIEPVPVVQSSQAPYKYSHTDQDHHYYQGTYDITHILSAKERPGLSLVMTVCYTENTQTFPVNDVTLVSASVQQNEKGEWKKIAVIPEGYQHINFALGRNRDSFLCFRNTKPMQMVYKAGLLDRFPKKDYRDSPLSQAIQMFCFNEGIQLTTEQESCKCFSFILTTVEGSSGKVVPRIYITCLIFYEPITEAIAKQLHIQVTASSKVYMPKAICLVSHWPFLDNYRSILKEIYRLHLSAYEVPLERIICNLVQEVPLPDQGVTSVLYNIGREKLEFSRPPPEYLPYVPYSCLEYLFRSLRVHDVISLWSCLMIERKVLLISTQKSLLTNVALALTSLVYPFRWEQVLIPILPAPLKNYIETIFPYIIGVSPGMLTSDIEVPVDAVQVDLDNGSIHLREPLPRLPDKLHRQLYNRLMTCANIYSPTDPHRCTCDEAFSMVFHDDSESQRFDHYRVQDAFLEFQTALLKNYQRYFIQIDGGIDKITEARQCFNIPAFLSYHKSNRSDNFLYKVTETSLFASFIEKRIFSGGISYEITYFDKAIKFKRTRNDPVYVKPYYTSETLPTLYANDIGLEPGMVFRYERFPRLEDTMFCEPRRVQQLATNAAPKPTLNLKDETLMRMSHAEWAKFLLSTIHRVWFLTLTASMPRFREQSASLMDLALQVMDSMKKKSVKPDEDLYRRLIEACGRCGLRERVLSLFKRMKNQGIEPDACTHGVYVSAVAEAPEMQKTFENVLTLSDLPPDSLCLTLDLERCVFITEDMCPSCSYNLMHEDIMMGWERSYSNYTTTCPNCEKKFAARFLVIIEHQVVKNIQVEFLSPPIIRKELENLMYKDGDSVLLAKDFVDKHRILFWNMALYFDLMKLPNFFLNPTFDPENIPFVISDFIKSPVKTPKSSRNTDHSRSRPMSNYSADEYSDTSSVSGVSSYSNASYNGIDTKIQNFVRSRSRNSSISSDNTTKSSSRNLSLKKLFAPYIEEFRNENYNKGLNSPLLANLDTGDKPEVFSP